MKFARVLKSVNFLSSWACTLRSKVSGSRFMHHLFCATVFVACAVTLMANNGMSTKTHKAESRD